MSFSSYCDPSGFPSGFSLRDYASETKRALHNPEVGSARLITESMKPRFRTELEKAIQGEAPYARVTHTEHGPLSVTETSPSINQLAHPRMFATALEHFVRVNYDLGNLSSIVSQDLDEHFDRFPKLLAFNNKLAVRRGEKPFDKWAIERNRRGFCGEVVVQNILRAFAEHLRSDETSSIHLPQIDHSFALPTHPNAPGYTVRPNYEGHSFYLHKKRLRTQQNRRNAGNKKTRPIMELDGMMIVGDGPEMVYFIDAKTNPQTIYDQIILNRESRFRALQRNFDGKAHKMYITTSVPEGVDSSFLDLSGDDYGQIPYLHEPIPGCSILYLPLGAQVGSVTKLSQSAQPRAYLKTFFDKPTTSTGIETA